ncbi:MAG: hypothetical protein ACREQW_08480, partial [Candidatus Binatia bacterium]
LVALFIAGYRYGSNWTISADGTFTHKSSSVIRCTRSGRAALLQAKTMYDFGSLPPLVLVLLCAPVRSAVSQVSQAVRREGSFYRPVPAHNPSWR